MNAIKSITSYLVMTVLALLMSVCAMAQDVESALAKFDKQTSVAAANLFFSELLKAEFVDEETVFPDGTPADSLKQQVWYWAGEWMYDQQQYEQAEAYALKALPLCHAGNDFKADCLNLLGLIYVRMGDVKNAANYAKQCLEIDMKSGDDDRISSSMNTVAGIYMAGYQAKEAEQYILGALEHASKVDNPARKAVLLGMASEIYHTLGQDEKALTYAEQAIETEEKLGSTPKLLIRLSQKGSALLGLHRYKEAEDIYRQVAPEMKAMGDYHSYAIALNRLGMSLLCQERQQEAIPYYREAADLFSKMGDLYNEIHSHRGLYESYWSLNPDSAKLELDRFDLLKDSLYTHSTADALSRYNAEFGNDQLQQENAEVRQAHRRTIIIGIALILLIAALAWYIIRRNRRRWQKQMQELVKEVERLKTPPSEGTGEAVPVEGTGEALFLMRVIEAVNAAMPTGNFGVEQIAAELNMSVQTFRRRLQNAAGESPKAYIQAIQMERAVKLLTGNREMPVSQVANLCGFDEASTFGHTFKRIYGCPPSEYRNRR
ncbi:MAG: tetratricopeptide repeat protein [Bacteroidaceae bacterium]|nr:tetratricopeptide repeat protein [Bacteroidaceae bacterium]